MPSVCDARRNILPDRTIFLVPPPFGAWGSFSMPAKIAINGYGTIGKRVADAVALQDDMRLVGVAKTKQDFEAKLAVRKAYAVYAANKEALAKFEKAGVKAAGILDDLVNEADLVVDCTPEESGYKALYEKAGVKAIWQGGEEHALTNLSFNAAANYADCIGASFVRVPSCNTTGLIRTLYPLDAHIGVEKVLLFSSRRRHTRSVSAFLLNRSSDLDPNFGRRVRNRRQLNSLQNTWPYGYSMPIAVRYTQDAFSRSGWLWPVDAKGEPLKATSYMAVGFYVAKYVNKKSDMDLAA